MGIPALNILTKDTGSQSKDRHLDIIGQRIEFIMGDTSDVDNKGFVREGVNSDIVLHDYVFVGVFTNDKAKYGALKYLKQSPFFGQIYIGEFDNGGSVASALYI